MNKQEALKRIEAQKETLISLTGWAVYVYIEELIKSLDEPEKVKVPPFVSVWYLINKDKLYKNIAYLCANWVKSTTDDTLFNWMSNTDNFIQILVNMHQFGYEVEEEKRYLVKMKGVFKGYEFLTFKFGRVWIFSNEEENEEFRTAHTQKELEEANFGWVFDCPGIEIEEVE